MDNHTGSTLLPDALAAGTAAQPAVVAVDGWNTPHVLEWDIVSLAVGAVPPPAREGRGRVVARLHPDGDASTLVPGLTVMADSRALVVSKQGASWTVVCLPDGPVRALDEHGGCVRLPGGHALDVFPAGELVLVSLHVGDGGAAPATLAWTPGVPAADETEWESDGVHEDVVEEVAPAGETPIDLLAASIDMGALPFAPDVPVRRPSRVRRWLGRLAAAISAVVLLVAIAVGVGPAFLPYRTTFVTGASMTPTIPMGSVAVLRPVSAGQLKVGDIIAFRRPGQHELVTHRIVREVDGRFVTRGDANTADDLLQIPATGEGWRVAFHVPYVGWAFTALHIAAVRLTVLVVGLLATAILAVKRIWR